jgi:Flp pilus assembly protein TadD
MLPASLGFPLDWHRSSIATLALLLVNSAYLAAFPAPSLLYFANVALHPVLALALAAAAIRWVWFNRTRLAALAWAAGVLLAAGGLLGLWILAVGATTPHRFLVDAHVTIGVAGTGVLLVALFAALRRSPNHRARVLAAAYPVAGCLLLAGAIAGRAATDRSDQNRYRIQNPLDAPLTMEGEGGGVRNPFFPSSAETNTGAIIPADFFTTSAACGRCHADIYNQWQSSAHHFSSFNNQWYRKSIEYMQDVVGVRPSKWCAGCHDHAVFFNGRFDRPIKDQIATREAQAGLACTSCHSIVHVKSSMGQGDFTIEYPPLHDLASSEQPILRWFHDTLLYLAPKPHRDAFLKPFHREQTAEFCSSCHKVHLDVPVNGYRWFRGFDEYDNWQASAVSGQGARSFYYPVKAQQCADCHMPLVASNDPAAKDGKVRSHRFPGANTAIPFVNHDRAQLATVQAFLRDGQISVDVFGISHVSAPAVPARTPGVAEPQLSSTFAVGEESMNFGAPSSSIESAAEVVAPLDKVTATVKRGESVRVEVVVRTRKVGHFFPGGTVDAFDVWVEFEAVDDKGQVLLHSGALQNGNGPVDPSAHFYRSLQIDEHGNVINKRNAWMTRSVAYVHLIAPGAADTIHYRLDVPENAGDKIVLRAKVKYRKFSWWNTQWSYAGVRDPAERDPSITTAYNDGAWVFSGSTAGVSGAMKSVPDLPVTILAEAEASLRVAPRTATTDTVKSVADRTVRERWNDYGIGLLLQGDLKGAEAAFRTVTEIEPEYADGWVNVARAQIQEGNVAAAETTLRRALQVDETLAKTHFFLATVLKTTGRYDEALASLRKAADQYPRDRVVLNQIGRVLFLQRKFDAAVAAFTRVLAIDPEDLQAHYNLMLCYQGLGNTPLAAREQTLYTRFKADEASQSITGEFRLRSPEDNNERQSIHEHRTGRPDLKYTPEDRRPRRGSGRLTRAPGAQSPSRRTTGS